MPHFFFSYAREDDTDEHYLRTFFDDLRRKVCALMPCSEADAAFVDWEQRIGTDYTGNIPDNLAKSTVMVPIYSPNYFQKPYCGKEFSIFRDRARKLKAAASNSNPICIFPVMWVESQDQVPFAIRRFFVSRDATSLYEKKGLAHIMELGVKSEGERRDWYVDFRFSLAQQIVDAAATLPFIPPASAVDMAGVANAFFANKPPLVEKLDELKAGPNSAAFLYVGETEWEWSERAAYWPPQQNRAGFVSAAVAESREVAPQKIKFDSAAPDTFQFLQELQSRNSRVVVLVDSNAVGQPAQRQWLMQYDQKQFPHCATVVVGRAGIADNDVSEVFTRSRDTDLFFRNVPTAGRLAESIDQGLEILRIRLSNKAASSGPPAKGFPLL